MTGVQGTVEERFMEKVVPEPMSGCWLWTGAYRKAGYGSFNIGGTTCAPHRVAYELHVGPIPDGLDIDHLCRNRACVNPAHLEPVTRRENLLRGETITARNARKTRCVRGHLLADRNLRATPEGWRRCRTCHRDRAREYHRRRKI